MNCSTERILTTHVGRLPQPPELRAMVEAQLRGSDVDGVAFDKAVEAAVADSVNRQIEAGLDVINDGEMSKAGFNIYVHDRLTGIEVKPIPSVVSREGQDFPEYFNGRPGGVRGPAPALVATGPIAYTGHAALSRDIGNLRHALEGKLYTEAFLTSTAPENVGFYPGQNEYYASHEDFVAALAEALKAEYRAIVDAGFVLQIDMPVMKFNSLSMSLEEFRRSFAWLIELHNATVADIPEEQIRLHICYGGLPAPHTGDLHLHDYADILVKAHAAAFSLDQNVQHEHEWRVWKDVKLPDGKALIPGVVAHTTDTIEHPQLIADRLVRLANVVGRENVLAGTDCGLGGRVPQEIAWAKFRAMTEGAKLASKELWG